MSAVQWVLAGSCTSDKTKDGWLCFSALFMVTSSECFPKFVIAFGLNPVNILQSRQNDVCGSCGFCSTRPAVFTSPGKPWMLYRKDCWRKKKKKFVFTFMPWKLNLALFYFVLFEFICCFFICVIFQTLYMIFSFFPHQANSLLFPNTHTHSLTHTHAHTCTHKNIHHVNIRVFFFFMLLLLLLPLSVFSVCLSCNMSIMFPNVPRCGRGWYRRHVHRIVRPLIGQYR